MKRDLGRLSQEVFDLVVIGGGIYGACVAWEGVLRGLSVALLEQEDFGWATSANMQRIIHGGFRYLQDGDIKRMRESIRERRALTRIAPHLVRPQPFLLPTYRRGLQHRDLMRLALKFYNLIALDGNQGIGASGTLYGAGELVSREECLRVAPGLAPADVTGAAVWQDGLVHNPEALTLAFVQSAAREGACVANYTSVDGFLRRGYRIRGVEATDSLTGRSLAVRSKLVINTSGPWINKVMQLLHGSDHGWGIRFVKALSIVTPELTNEQHGASVLVPHRGTRKDSHDGCCVRYFILPWLDHSIVGSLNVLRDDDPGSCAARAEEVESFVGRLESAYPRAAVSPDDVSRVQAGLLPLSPRGPQNQPYNLRRHYRIIDHGDTENVEGVISVVGVKYTTARDVAEKVVGLALQKLHRPHQQSQSASIPLCGGAMENFDRFLWSVLSERPHNLDEHSLRQVVRNHGSEYRAVLGCIEENPALGGRVTPSSHILKAQVVYAVRHLMAQKLSDVIFRRTQIAAVDHPSRESLETCAGLMAGELSWSRQRAAREIEDTESFVVQIQGRSKNSPLCAEEYQTR